MLSTTFVCTLIKAPYHYQSNLLIADLVNTAGWFSHLKKESNCNCKYCKNTKTKSNFKL